MKKNKETLPEIKNDQAAEDFVAQADLTNYDLSLFKKAPFEFDKKEARVNLRMSDRLLVQIKATAKKRGIPYQRWIRETLEGALGG